ncbi:MAG TPA: glutamate--tRNA ligase [Coriobacteriia bacterium]
MSDVRVRFAPSPTGHLHIGGARTAIYNWAFARHTGGTFILRIDDTDPERSTPENTAAILRAMRWLGLDWDEGPEAGGDRGPYFQTQRGGSYSRALERLEACGAAYPCFCSAEELEGAREKARAAGGVAGYARTCRTLDAAEARGRIEAGEPHTWRLKVPEDRGDIVFDDAVRGEVTFPSAALDDFVLVRSDGTPTYNYASVVDDAEMGITHVIRGDDHLSNTPRQMLLLEALGFPTPVFAHLSMILGADGKRLSKRHGATSVEQFRDEGILPEALVNYLALLGWSFDDRTTIFSAEELISHFTLERVGKNPAIFDPEKLEWLDGVYIREMPPAALAERMLPWLEDAGLLSPAEEPQRRPWLVQLAPLVSERLKRLDEVAGMVRFLFEDQVPIDEAARAKVLEKEGAGRSLDAASDGLSTLRSWTAEGIEEALRRLPEALGLKPKVVFQAVRVAVSGTTVSLPLFESLALLGRERTLARLHAARTLAAE